MSIDSGNKAPIQQSKPDVIKPELKENLSRYIDLVESGADDATITSVEKQIQENVREKFSLTKLLPKFFEAVASAKTDWLQLRVAHEHVIKDNRGENKDETKNEVKKEIRQDLTKSEIRDKISKAEISSERFSNITRDQTQKPLDDSKLTPFEKVLIKRFEKGENIEYTSPDGKKHFSIKSDGDWKQFFGKLAHRAVINKESVGNIKELIFRGLVAKAGKGIVISDLALNTGRIEKFIRFSVMSQIFSMLSKLSPGEGIPKELLAELGSKELLYLALASRASQKSATSQKASEGKFTSQAIEERASKDLGILARGDNLRDKSKGAKGKGFKMMGMRFFDKDSEEENPYRFVPWWQGDTSTGKSKWNMSRLIFYASLIAIAIIGFIMFTLKVIVG